MILSMLIVYGSANMTAGGILALIPVIVFMVLVQKHLVKGLTLGALKG